MPVYHRVCPSRSDKCLMASAGFKADAKTLQKTLLTRQVMYQHNHNKVMSCPAMAQLLSNTLYYKRFFPYYTFNICAGLDENVRARAPPPRCPSTARSLHRRR